MHRRTITLALFVCACTLPVRAQHVVWNPSSDTLGYHVIRTDATGRIVPWSSDDPATAYDHVLRLVWHFWRDMEKCPNGVPYYLQHQVWTPEHDPRGLGGDQLNMALSSWTLLYPYLGDPDIHANMVLLANYYLDHSLSASNAMWPDLPYPYNTDLHSGVYDGDMVAGKGMLQPDKAGAFGFELTRLYEITGNERYLKAAEIIARRLAERVQPGDAEHSPLPFRVHAVTGEVYAAYTANWTGTLLLFEALDRHRRGDRALFRKAHDRILAWVRTYPLQTNNWGPFFEDVRDYSNTQTNAVSMATYILEHRDAWGPSWQKDARSILDWTYSAFANREWERYGVVAINEQTTYQVPGNGHSARQSAAELLYTEVTGDTTRIEDAVRLLNWATYMVDTDGKNRFPRDDIWLTDGYGDYVRHYLRAMASLPRLAPADQNHILRSTSVIRSTRYDPKVIRYTTSQASSTERIRTSARPTRVLSGGRELPLRDRLDGPGWTWTALSRGGFLDIRHEQPDIEIRIER